MQFERREEFRQLNSNPYERENRRMQLQDREQLRPEREQRRQERRQLDSNPYEQETRDIQLDERQDTDPFDDPEQLETIDYGDTWPYEIILYSQFLQLDYPDGFVEAAPAYPYVADGIRHLSDALFVLSEQNDAIPNARNRTHSQINDLADRLQHDSTDINAPEITSNAFVQSTEWMQQIGDKTFPFSNANNEINDVQEAARRIDTSRPLNDQRYEVRRFFELSDIAIRALNQEP